jgi:hypothetical protein
VRSLSATSDPATEHQQDRPQVLLLHLPGSPVRRLHAARATGRKARARGTRPLQPDQHSGQTPEDAGRHGPSRHPGEFRNNRTASPEAPAATPELDRQENRVLDLIGDPEWPQAKIKSRLQTIRESKQRTAHQLQNTTDELTAGYAVLASVL